MIIQKTLNNQTRNLIFLKRVDVEDLLKLYALNLYTFTLLVDLS